MNILTPSILNIQKWAELPTRMGIKNEWTGFEGVYAFLSGEEVIYIGSSTSIGNRLYKHPTFLIAELKGYQSLRVKALKTSCSKILEYNLIIKYRPSLNKLFNPNYKREVFKPATI